ncbi:MAG TPA: alpha/beta fold hydrolase [Solirubrobacterales bacterium]|nr:alpha/beta fold hydrolase [Solirubrobacterales bacterium]
MAGAPPKTVDGIAYREELPAAAESSAPAALFLHGYPTSSYLWRNVLPAAAAAGYRAIAPDLPGFGDSPADLPGTWERQVEHVERFRRGLGLEQLVLGVHDWGGLIGLRWACDHPDAVRALVITDTGFFPDGRWHGMAKTLRTEGEGEQVLANINRDLFGMALRQISSAVPDDAIDEFWKAYGDEQRRRAQLDLYRSGDFSKLEAYDGRLAALGVPAVIVWGAKDEFAPVGGAHRFHKQLPEAALVVLEDAGHFVMEDDPSRVAAEVRSFLGSL